MEDSGEAFDERLRVETSSGWLGDVFGAQPSPRRVRVKDDVLDIEQMRTVQRREITNAFLVSENDRMRVVILHGRRDRFVVHLRSRDDAERFLRAIQFAKTQRNTPFRVLSSFRPPLFASVLVGWLAFVGYVSFGGRTWLLAAFTAAMFALLVAVSRIGGELIVGRDGVTLSRFGRRRFISYGDMESLNRFAEVATTKRGRSVATFSGVVLHLNNGEALSLRMTTLTKTSDELVGAYERISDALAAWRAENPSNDSGILQRGSRSTKEWLAALRTMGSAEEEIAYRVAPIDREALLVIAEDPVKQAHSRAAAAMVLREKLTSAERERLEASTKTIAEPRLRVAMQLVVEQKSDEDLEAILDDLDPTDPRIR